MGWRAYVETDFGEVFCVLHSNGLLGGKALLCFLTITGSVCEKSYLTEDEKVVAWISNFNKHSEYDFCKTLEKLNNAYYPRGWDYQDDEYEFFLHRYPGSEMSEADFIKANKKVREMWTGIQELIRDLRIFIDEFKRGYLQETDWYVEEDTIPDFEALLNTLIYAKNERDAERARIRIE